MVTIHWLHPALLWILLLFPLLLLWQRRQHRHARRLPFSSLDYLHKQPTSLRSRLRDHYRYGYLLVWLLVALALAGPRAVVHQWPVWGEGVDVMFVLDLSGSMNTADLPPSRLAVAKQFLLRLLQQKRQRSDRFGLVIFADQAYTLCPLTVDHGMLQDMLKDVQSGHIGNNTAIGDAIAAALARLRHQPQRKRAILLLTDGETNAGRIHPLRAVRKARDIKIPIYTIWLGKQTETSSSAASSTNRPAPPQRAGWPTSVSDMPEPPELATSPWKALEQIAQTSGGQASALTDVAAMSALFDRVIQQMLPERLQQPRYFSLYQDRFSWLLWSALGLLLLLVGLELTVLRSIP